uniref:Reverse transcriptase RNase H-like domain-containing protein n=1 Tax=Romanomermis culicivorax TaxID=13658 RepID=A0A915IRM7_ROMCU
MPRRPHITGLATMITKNKQLGQKFTVMMDHQALVSILAHSSDGQKTQGFNFWTTRLAQYDIEIQNQP